LEITFVVISDNCFYLKLSESARKDFDILDITLVPDFYPLRIEIIQDKTPKSLKPWKLFGYIKPFLIYLCVKTES